MLNFELNISDVKKYIDSSKKKLNEYSEIMNVFSTSVSNIDGSWKDKNTLGFVDLVNRDNLNFNKFLLSLEKYLNELNVFCITLSGTFQKNFYISNIKKIKYNSEKIDYIISCLNNCYNYLNNIYYLFDSINLPMTFKYYNHIEDYKNDTLNYRNSVYNIREKFKNVKKQLDNVFAEARQKIDSVDIDIISSDVCSHTYKICSASEKKKKE